MVEVGTVENEERAPIEHELKVWESYFHALWNGSKPFELRRDDRDFRTGDTLRLRETFYRNREYTGREIRTGPVTYILRHEPEFGLMDGFAILGLEPKRFQKTTERSGT